MKKVLMVSCEGLANGGVQTVMMQIVRSLKDEYIFDALLFTDEVRYFDNEFLSYGGEIFRMPRYAGSNPVKARMDVYFKYFILYGKMKKLFRENNYDVIHCHNDYEAAICAKAAKKSSVKICISHQHTEYKPQNRFQVILNKFYKNMLLKNATHLIGASELACVSYFGADSHFEVINNPYNDKRFVYTEGENYNKPVICQIGRFSENKNQQFTLGVFENILKRYPDSVLNLVGVGENVYSEEVKHRIEKNNLGDKVFLYPPDADIYAVMNESNILVMPSLSEGFGIVLIEAQAVGLNCYASDTVPELTNVGGCTYLSLKSGAVCWAEKIAKDFKEGKIKRTEYNTEKFKTENISNKYRKIYGGN